MSLLANAGTLAAVVLIFFVCLGIRSRLAAIERRLILKEPPEGTTPAHVVFSNRILALPPLPAVLDRPLWIQNASESFGTFRNSGDWVERGDVLVSFIVTRGVFVKNAIAAIRSPVRGRLIHTNSSRIFNVHPITPPPWFEYMCLIELPIGERIPESLSEAFGELRDRISEHKRTLLKEPHDRSFPPFSDQQVEELLVEIAKLTPHILSKNEPPIRDVVEWHNLYKPHGIGSDLNLRTPSPEDEIS
jgi:hypothetical protein